LRQVDDKTGSTKGFEIKALAGTARVHWVRHADRQQRRGLWTQLRWKSPWLSHFSTPNHHLRGVCGRLGR
jgi:hypothetical protein